METTRGDGVPGLFGEVVDSLYRGIRLRCPCCGYGQLFATRFRTHERCSVCDERFEREPGQWFGAVYVNLCLTLLLVTGGYLLARAFTPLSPVQQLWIWIPLAVIGPLLLHRPSTGLWTSLVFIGEGLYLRWPRR